MNNQGTVTEALREMKAQGRRRRKVDAEGIEARIAEHAARVAKDAPPVEGPKGRPRLHWCPECGSTASNEGGNYGGDYLIYRLVCDKRCGWRKKIVRRIRERATGSGPGARGSD